MVDDQVDFLRLVSAWLRMLRGIVTVEAAASAADALAMLDEFRPEVVITDIRMPEMDGIDFTRRLKARPAPPVVVVMTGLESRRFREDAHDAGADYFVEKSQLHKLLPPFLIRRFGVGQIPV